MIAQLEGGSAAEAELPGYLVGHGNSGGFGRFAPAEALTCRRGDRVVIESRRGLELGVVLCEATPQHARLLPAAAAGRLLRRATAEDERQQQQLHAAGQRLFEAGRRLAEELGLPLEVVDVELPLDGRAAVLQYLAWAEGTFDGFAEALGRELGLTVLLESLTAEEEEEPAGGCGKPGCGRAEGGGGCTTCGSDGGCSSCGSGKVEMTAYFAHLRAKMEERHQRTPLL